MNISRAWESANKYLSSVRITSYNVCYTKLLRYLGLAEGIAIYGLVMSILLLDKI